MKHTSSALLIAVGLAFPARLSECRSQPHRQESGDSLRGLKTKRPSYLDVTALLLSVNRKWDPSRGAHDPFDVSNGEHVHIISYRKRRYK